MIFPPLNLTGNVFNNYRLNFIEFADLKQRRYLSDNDAQYTFIVIVVKENKIRFVFVYTHSDMK